MQLVFLGPPGAGKGTQAVRLAAFLGVPHIATGDLLRENVQGGTPLGLQARATMDRGELVPDALVVAMMNERLSRADARGGWLLDGYPRSLGQAEALRAFAESRGRPIDRVFLFVVPDEEVVRRLAGRRVCAGCGRNYQVDYVPPRKEGVCDHCGGELQLREDDRPETVRHRLTVYQERNAGLIAMYRGLGLLEEIDGTLSPDPLAAVLRDRIGRPDLRGAGRA